MIEVTDQRILDLLICAFEGGSNYWYMIIKKDPKDRHVYNAAFDGHVIIADQEDNDKEYRLDKEVMCHGLDVMEKLYTKHFQDFVNEHDDAITGDVFLQCCLFGEVKYG